jgi:hypothetical protein
MATVGGAWLSGAWAMMAASRATEPWLIMEGAMKVGLLGTGFGIAHARIYHTHPQVTEVVVFGRTPAKLQAFADEFGNATTTDLAAIYDDPAIDLVDVCLPTRCTPSMSPARWMPASTCSASCPWPPPWTTPAASSTPKPPATGRSSSTCSAASIPPPRSCTPPSPKAVTAR